MNITETQINVLPLRGKFKVSINGGAYMDIVPAAKHLGIHPETLRKKIRERKGSFSQD